MTRRAPFTQTDVARFLKGARSAGVQLDRVEIEIVRSSGNIVMRPAGAAADPEDNPWNSVLTPEGNGSK